MVDIWMIAEDRIEMNTQMWQPQHLLSLQKLYSDLFDWVRSRRWPLHPNELSAVQREMNRVDDAFELYNCTSLERAKHILRLANSREGRHRFADAERILLFWQNYGEGLQYKFKRAFRVTPV
jgi:hypothetical protein